MADLAPRYGTVPDGLRERKKRQTKRRIADEAASLFRLRGYENVRISDIATAAEVSEQTLYNYFPTKEHLIFDLDSEYEERIVAIVLKARAGLSITRTLREEVLRFLAEASRLPARKHELPTTLITAGPAVRRVWIELNARVADRVADALIRNQGGKIHPAAAKIAVRLIVSIFAVILEELGSTSATGKGRSAAIRRLKTAVGVVIRQIEHAISLAER